MTGTVLIACILFYILSPGTCGRVRVSLPVVIHLRHDRGHYGRQLPNGRGRQTGDSSVRRNFLISSELILLKSSDPQIILDAFCDTIFPNKSPILVYINNPYFHDYNSAATSYFRGITNFLGIPVITWDPECYQSTQTRPDTKTLLISPTVKHQVQAMLSILERYNWTDFSIVTTTEPGYIDFISSIQDLTKPPNSEDPYEAIRNPRPKYRILETVILRNVTDQDQICADMESLKEADSRVSLMYSRRSQTYSILECADDLDMTGAEYVWVMSMDSVPKNSKSYVSSDRLPYGLMAVWYDYGQQAMVDAIQTSLTIWKSVLKKTVQGGRRDYKNPAFNCSSTNMSYWADGTIMYEYLLNVSTSSNRQQKIDFNRQGQLKHPHLKILNLQRTSPRGGKHWEVVGEWNRDGLAMQRITWPGEAIGPPKGKPKRRFVRIATLRENPYVIYEDMPSTGICTSKKVPCEVYPRDEETNKRLSNETISMCCKGLSIDLLIKLSAALDFDYELFEVYDGLWGAEVNKEWNGLVRVLMDRKADMVITSLKINPERNRAVDFSVPYLKTGITIIVSIREGAISPTAFLEPYDYPSWCFILVFSVHATGASIFIFEWLSPYGLDKGNALSKEHRFSLFRSLWLIWAMLFSAAVTTDTPRGISSRFMANLWALFALVFLASYTANLAAFMITKEEYYDLSGIQDWRLQNPKIMKPPFKFGTIPNGSTETNIRSNDIDMYKYMVPYNMPSVEEGIKAVKRQQLHAFIYDATVLEYQAGKDKDCRLITVGKWGAMTGYGVAFPRGSSWIDKVNNIILELKQEGEMERLQKFWLSGACHNTKKKDPNSNRFGQGVKSSTLGIRNFTSAFIFLASGIGLGALLLVLEHLYFRFGRKRLKKWDKRGCCSLVSLSMGKSLTFQHYVTEAMDVHLRHRCKDKICQDQYLKVQQELELALGKVDQLQALIADLRDSRENNCGWKFRSERKREITDSNTSTPKKEAIEKHSEVDNDLTQRRRQGNGNDVTGSESAQVEKVRDELMKLLQSEYERESVI